MAESCPFNPTPLAVPRFINNLPISNLNYTGQDYHSIKKRLLELIKINFENDFNDFNESSMAIMLIEVWAAIADMLSFKIDQIANELFIDTVTELDNAFRLCKLVGYKPMPPLPAKAMFMARTNSVYSDDIVLKTPIVVKLDDINEVVYELYPADVNNDPVFDSDIILSSGVTLSDAIVGVEGRARKSNFTSNGKANQIFTLPYENVFYKSIRVFVNDKLWQEVEHFTESSPQEEYIIDYNAYYKPSIIFGDGAAGRVPSSGATINISCRLPNKNTSEIISGAFDTKVFAEAPSSGASVIVQVKNYTKSEFGYPGDSINDIKKKLPAYIRTQNRGVTGQDYKFLTDSFATPYNGTVGKSNVILRNHGCAGNIIDIIILAKTGDHRLVKANDNLKADLSNYLKARKMFTDYICIKDGEVILVDISIDVYLNSVYKKHENDIKLKIVEKLEDYFHLSNWEFGESLREKDIIKVLAGVKEVKQFDITFTTNKSIENSIGTDNFVSVKYNEVIRPDNININFTYKNPGDL